MKTQCPVSLRVQNGHVQDWDRRSVFEVVFTDKVSSDESKLGWHRECFISGVKTSKGSKLTVRKIETCWHPFGGKATVIASLNGIRANQVLLTFANSNDLYMFKSYHAKAVATDGTVTGLYAGLMCAALKRSKMQTF